MANGPKVATFTIVGTEPLLFGKQVFDPKLNGDETPAQYELRTVLSKVTTNNAGHVAINADAIKRSLEWAAGWLNDKLPGGGGMATFKKRFRAGVQPQGPHFVLSNGKQTLVPEDLEIQPLSVPSNGTSGGAKRVTRHFPTLRPTWSAECSIIVFDTAIDEAVFEKHIKTAGTYDGIGAMRIGNGGPNGRYTVEDLKFADLTL